MSRIDALKTIKDFIDLGERVGMVEDVTDKDVKWLGIVEQVKSTASVLRIVFDDTPYDPKGNSPKEKFENYNEHVMRKMSVLDDLKLGYDKLTNLEVAFNILIDFESQVKNGGILQYIQNGYASESQKNGLEAARIIRSMAVSLKDIDQEVSECIRDMSRLALSNLDLENGGSERDLEEFEEKSSVLEEIFYGFDDDRLSAFYLNIIENLGSPSPMVDDRNLTF